MIVFDNVPEMVAAAVVCFADAHGVVGEVDVAVVAWEGQCMGRAAPGGGLMDRAWELEGGSSCAGLGNLQKSARERQYGFSSEVDGEDLYFGILDTAWSASSTLKEGLFVVAA